MIYLTISDNSIEAIQTKKDLFGKEKIVATSQKNLADGMIAKGIISDVEKFQAQLEELFTTAYPKIIDDSDICVGISDKQVLTYRFTIEKSSSKENISEKVLHEAKKHIPYDPTELENFYKILPADKGDTSEVLYTAMTQSTIMHFGSFFQKLGGKLKFLSSTSFGIYELVKHLIPKGNKILYAIVEEKTWEYYVLDENGPILTLDIKIGEKDQHEVLKGILDQLKEKYNITISQVILAGKTSIEVNAHQIEELVHIPISKMGDLAESIYKNIKMEIDTGGQPRFLFASVIGLLLLSKQKAAPNFINDVDTHIKKDISKPISSISPSDNSAPETKPSADTAEVSQEVVKKQETIRVDMTADMPLISADNSSSRKGKKGIIIAVIIVVAIIVAILIIVLRSSIPTISLPFNASPTPTPTVTVMPTVTPTPTIDAKLKRSDIKVSVQNGTQKIGYAKDIGTFLEETGYKNVSKSNADTDTYQTSQIKIKKSKQNYLPLFSSDLKDKFVNPEISELGEDEKFDIVLILGQK